MPDGPIIEVAGLKFSGGGKTIPWRRDLVEMFSIHLDIPQGVTSLDADLDFLLSAPATGFSAGASATACARPAELESGAALSQGLREPRTSLFAPSLKIAVGLEVRDRAAGREGKWRYD